MANLDTITDEDEVQFPTRFATGIGRQSCGIHATQARGFHEQVDLGIAPESVEVASHNNGLVAGFHQAVKVPQLFLPVAILQGQVHQKDRTVLKLQFDNETLDAGIEEVKALAMHARRGEEGIALLADDGHSRVEGTHTVFAGVGTVVPELCCDMVSLVHALGAHGTRVHLDQADQVRIKLFKEGSDAIQNSRVPPQIPGPGQGQMERGSGASGITDIVDDETQSTLYAPAGCGQCAKTLDSTDGNAYYRSQPAPLVCQP